MWLRGDVSDNPTHNGDLRSALGAIEAQVYLMPGTTDQYFISEEIEEEGEEGDIEEEVKMSEDAVKEGTALVKA